MFSRCHRPGAAALCVKPSTYVHDGAVATCGECEGPCDKRGRITTWSGREPALQVSSNSGGWGGWLPPIELIVVRSIDL